MSTDPYHAVQSEIQGSLQTADQLRASFIRIRSTAREGSEELEWARNELKATLAALEADLEDLDESVRIVENTGARMFGLEDAEVMQRRRYVSHVRQQIEGMRDEVEGRPPSSNRPDSGAALPPVSPVVEDDQAQWARQEQQMMMQQQDQTLDSITGTLTTLAQQAGLIGQEVVEHNEMLGDLEQNIDSSDAKLSGAMRKMKKFIRDTEEKKSGWCIAILIVILIILLAAVILV
ncbi:t-SNARE [Amylostereum chailletii]|nr:t-SNARE [Amylostereum chailletii]